MAKTREQARKELKAIADMATGLGYQVTFQTRTETEGYAAGRALSEITISTLADD